MIRDYRIEESVKPGFESEESYIVVRDKEVFLRLVGGRGLYRLLTATAGEGALRICADQRTLKLAASRTAIEFEIAPEEDQDSIGRDFVRICTFTIDDNTENARRQTISDVYEVCDALFKNFDDAHAEGRTWDTDLRDLYEILAVDDSGGDVYLTDGLWLGRSGDTVDRGR